MKKPVDFSNLSSIYDLLGSCAFFGALHRSQTHFLKDLKPASHALIVGGGTGRFLVDLLKSGKVEHLTYVDISPGMISRAKKKVSSLGFEHKVEFICGGIDSIPQKKYELICTHYFLDCFEGEALCGLISSLKGLLHEDGTWHFSDFYQDESTSFFKRKFIGFLYWFFRLFCGLQVRNLGDFRKLFKEEGLECEGEKFFIGKLMRTAVYRKQSNTEP